MGFQQWIRRTSIQDLTPLILVLLFAHPAMGQMTGEASVMLVTGRDASFSFRGFTAGGGVLINRRVGLDASLGFAGDDSDEGVLAPMLSIGGTWRFLRERTLVPFAASGFSRLGDVGYWYAGGGMLATLSPRAALRFELRSFEPMTSYAACPQNPRSECKSARRAIFAGAGLLFGF